MQDIMQEELQLWEIIEKIMLVLLAVMPTRFIRLDFAFQKADWQVGQSGSRAVVFELAKKSIKLHT